MARSKHKTGGVRAGSKANKRTVRIADSTERERILWDFGNVDNGGEFAFSIDRIEADGNLRNIFSKMINYATMTWADVRGQTHDNAKSKCHFLDMDSLSGSARRRVMIKISEENVDKIFSFALTNKLRVIGVRDGRIFHVIWYDPEHEFCPSLKKHT